MSCGTVLEGFVLKADDQYLELIEYDNILVIVTLADISLVRLRAKEDACCCKKTYSVEDPVKEPVEKKMYPAKEDVCFAAVVSKPRTEEFSMSLPKPDANGLNGEYESPTFTRTTTRGSKR
jgi:hypothetical protein